MEYVEEQRGAITWDVRIVIKRQMPRTKYHNEEIQLKNEWNKLLIDYVPKTVLRLLVLSAEEPNTPSGAHCWPLSKANLRKDRPKSNCYKLQQIIPIYNIENNKIKIVFIF
jgi:hypothetical protein